MMEESISLLSKRYKMFTKTFQTCEVQMTRELASYMAPFCETRSKRSVEVYKGRNLDPLCRPPPTVGRNRRSEAISSCQIAFE